LINFSFNKDAATQTIAQFITLGVTDFHTLLIYLYLADRRSLVETGCNITGANYNFCMQLPQSADINSLLMEECFHLSDGVITLKTNPGDGEISDYTCTTVQAIVEQYSCFSYDKLLKLIATFPEFTKRARMNPDVILKNEGFSEEEIKVITERIDYHNWFRLNKGKVNK
jgi:hypothetical protein